MLDEFYEEKKTKKYIVSESRINFFCIKDIERKQEYIAEVVIGIRIVHAGYLI